MAGEKIQTLKGMRDIFGKEAIYYEKIYELTKEIASLYNYQTIETPILERVEVFKRGIGEATEIVEKQMFVFKTKGGEKVALRPEATASICRAYIEGGMKAFPKPVKLFYFGPFFRYEKPQLGRFREFFQFGFESLGKKSPAVDAEIIKISLLSLEKVGLKDLVVEINSLGCLKCRANYKKALKDYLKPFKVGLCKDCQGRLKKNPLRVLDCKQEKCRQIFSGAPQNLDYLCEECKEHFKKVIEFLEFLNLPYKLNPYLVRGLDYYTKTVFEIFEKERKYGALIGGGRYDNLIKTLKGEETAGCGGAGGVERIILTLKDKGIEFKEKRKKVIYLAQVGELAKKEAMKLFERLIRNKIKTIAEFSKDSLRAQLKRADELNVSLVLILGEKEAREGEILIRDMEKGRQKKVSLKNLEKEIRKKLR